jgi:hypothetical protein
MSTNEADDRREYYRIDDSIALEIQPLATESLPTEDIRQDDSTLFNLLADLHAMDFESQHLLRQIGEKDRATASYLKTINKRVDLLGRVVAQHLLRDVGPPRRVILSEGGIRFSDENHYPAGMRLTMRIVLLPQALGLQLNARVLHCQPRETGGFDIGTEFEETTDAQRQLLARHILQRQAQARRLAREQAEPSL